MEIVKKKKLHQMVVLMKMFLILCKEYHKYFCKNRKKKENELGKVFHFDLYGKRELKYDFLIANSLKLYHIEELKPNAPNYFLLKRF